MVVLITDTCINCDACIEECPATAIVSADESHFVQSGEYVIRVHKSKGIMSPEVSPMPWREGISTEQKEARVSVGKTLRLYN